MRKSGDGLGAATGGGGETEKLERMNLVTLRRRKPPLPHKVLVL